MAQRYNTGNPRPSNSMKDVNDNALANDDYLNSEMDTFIDRLGDERDTLRGSTKKMLVAGAAVVEETRQNLIPLSRQYMTLADAQADIANIPDGSTTYVRSADESSLADEYINNGGTLDATGRRMPSQFSVLAQGQVMGEFDANEGQFRRASEGELIWSGHIHEWQDFRTLNQIGFHVPSFTNSGPSSVETRVQVFSDGALAGTLYLPRLSAR
ncbi:hypothetical protein [Raoultella terrigena]|uniref:hypothetical protein n=1 Tax=Raoultella terrigena TaxID=577 RepID=UPI00349F9A4D